MTTKITPAMRAALFNLHHGHWISRGLHGASAHGGLQGTIAALFKRRLIDNERKLTDWGKQIASELFDPPVDDGSEEVVPFPNRGPSR